MIIKQQNIEKLIENLNKEYNVFAIQNHLFPELITIQLKQEELNIDTSKSIGFELKDDKLTFIGYDEHKETLDLADYNKEKPNEQRI